MDENSENFNKELENRRKESIRTEEYNNWSQKYSQFSLSIMSISLWSPGLQHTSLPWFELSQTHAHRVSDAIYLVLGHPQRAKDCHLKSESEMTKNNFCKMIVKSNVTIYSECYLCVQNRKI